MYVVIDFLMSYDIISEVADFCGPESRKPLPDVKNNLNKTKNINVENNNTSN